MDAPRSSRGGPGRDVPSQDAIRDAFQVLYAAAYAYGDDFEFSRLDGCKERLVEFGAYEDDDGCPVDGGPADDGPALRPYRVLYRPAGARPAEAAEAFACDADDAGHAREQLLNAEPAARVAAARAR